MWNDEAFREAMAQTVGRDPYGHGSTAVRGERDRREATVVGAIAIGSMAIGRLAIRVRVPVERQLSVQVPPGRLLGRPPVPGGASLDRIVLVMSHASDEMVVTPVDGAEVARRATHSFLFELSDLLGHYRRFRFAFPDARNALIEDLEARYERRAVEAFGEVPAITVRHPYPLEIDRLHQAIAPALA